MDFTIPKRRFFFGGGPGEKTKKPFPKIFLRPSVTPSQREACGQHERRHAIAHGGLDEHRERRHRVPVLQVHRPEPAAVAVGAASMRRFALAEWIRSSRATEQMANGSGVSSSKHKPIMMTRARPWRPRMRVRECAARFVMRRLPKRRFPRGPNGGQVEVPFKQAYATSPLFLDNLHFDQVVHYFNLGFVHDTFDDLFEMEIV